MHAGLSQVRLAEASRVSQSTISRLERGKASSAAMFKLVLLGDALGNGLPLAFCPHDHVCAWQRLDDDGIPTQNRAAFGSANYFQSLLVSTEDSFLADAEDD